MTGLKGRALSHQLWGWACACIVVFVAAGYGFGHVPQSRSSSKDLRVLFIGNSLTYWNDLPSMVEALAKASGQRRLAYKVIAFADFSLEDHWNQGDSRKAIARGGWDIVVLQQGPSASVAGRQSLLEDARRFAQEIHSRGARPALFMVWPQAHRRQDFERAIESYRLAADEVGGLLFPVGEAWRAAWKRNPDLALYSTDGLHPTAAGSYLAALIIYEQLYGQSPVGLPSNLKTSSGKNIEVPAEQARLMQEAAAETIRNPGRR